MIMYYKFIIYPDGHGSAHLMDDKGNELGLCCLFPDSKIMAEVEKELQTDPHFELDITYDRRK